MQTATQITTQINGLFSEIAELRIARSSDEKEEKKRDRKINTLTKKLPQLKEFRNYLETKPSKTFLQSEKERIENRINKIMENFNPLDPERFKKAECTKALKIFEKELGVTKLRAQLKAIDFLLK